MDVHINQVSRRMENPTMDTNDANEPTVSGEDLGTPLLSRSSEPNSEHLRQRSGRAIDVEAGTVESSRILDRSGAFRQSRGRWSVHRLSRHPGSQGNNCCPHCFRGRVWNEWNLGGWFHRLAYQRTGILMLILFCAYSSIVMFFAALYLSVSMLGHTTESNPDGSEKLIPYCQMEINNKMEALYLSLSTMASIGYGGK